MNGSSESIRRNNSLASGSPGTIAISPESAGWTAISRDVEPQPAFQMGLVGSMTGEAIVGKDRADIAVVTKRFGRKGASVPRASTRPIQTLPVIDKNSC